MVDGRSSLKRTVRPADASALLLNADRIRFACDPYRNQAWKQASQMTTGVDGTTPSVAFANGRPAIDEWAAKLTNLLLHSVDPQVLALKVQNIPKKDPWEEELQAARRGIVVRSIIGRCLSNHLAAILQETAEPVLPASAIAYRPRRADVVHAAILKVATAIGIAGYRFWSKLDIKDCFNQLPRKAVARVMKSLGYPERFIELVMLSTGAPRYRRVQGAWVEQNSNEGCPAGLPESSTLVNLLFLAFDQWVQSHCAHLVYFRYCDDFLFLGRTQLEVERAVGELLRFTKRHGLRLKGVSPNQSPASLTHDIRAKRLTFLGAEIGSNGNVHIPSEVLEAQLAKIRYRMDRAAQKGHLVVGRSRYATSGRRPRGVPTQDRDDVLASVVEFYRYWFELNRGEAKVFLGRAQQEFNVNPRSGAVPHRKVWVAALGHSDSLVGGGKQAEQDDTSDPLERWVRFQVIPLIREVQQGIPSGTPYELLGELANQDLGGTSDPGTEEPRTGLRYPWGHPHHEATRLWSTPASRDPRGLQEDDVEVDAKELSSSATGAFGFSAAPRGLAGSHEASGATTLGSPQPPGQPSGPDWRLILLRHRYEPETDTVIVTTDDFSALGKPFGAWEMRYEAKPPAWAVVEHLLRRLAQTRPKRAVVAMEHAWLAKLLLQDGREFRSLGLFQLVAELHAIDVDVVVIGPVGGVAGGELLSSSGSKNPRLVTHE